MDPFTLEITAHRIGGAEVGERTWGPWSVPVAPDVPWIRHTIPGRERGHDGLDITFTRPWVPVRPGLISTSVRLSDRVGQPLGTERPVLVSTLPSDVPLYSCTIAPDTDRGVFSLGLRLPIPAWAAEHLRTAAEDAETYEDASTSTV